MGSPRRRLVCCCLGLALAAACSTADEPGAVAPPSPDRPEATYEVVTESAPAVEVSASGELRLGDGNGLEAFAVPGTDRLVVVTTAGWVELDADGEPVRDLVPIEDAVTFAALDGDRLATISGDPARLLVHDVGSGEVVTDVDLPHPAIEITALTAVDGGFDVSTASVIERYDPSGAPTSLIEAEPDARIESAVSVGRGQSAYAVVRDASAATSLVRWSAQSDGATPIDAGGDPSAQLGVVAASASGDLVAVEVFAVDGAGSIVVLDADTGDEVRTVGLGGSAVQSWVVLDGGAVVVASSEGVSFHGTDGGEPLPLPAGDVAQLVATVGDDSSVVAVRRDGSAAVVTSSGEIGGQLDGAGPLRVARRPDAGSLVGVGNGGRVVVWTLGEAAPSLQVERYAAGTVTDVDLSADGTTITQSLSSGVVSVTSLDGVTTVLDHGGRDVDGFDVSPDRSVLISGVGERLGPTAFDDTVTRWDLTSGAATGDVGGEGESVAGCSFFQNLIRFSPDGRWVAVNSHDFTVSLLDAGDLSTHLALPAHPGNVHDFVFSPDGSQLATSAEDWIVRIWDVEDGSLVREWAAPLGGYWSIAFSPDGSQLAAIGSTGQLDLVDPTDGTVLLTAAESASWSSNVVFSPDGRRVIAGNTTGDVLVWSADDGSVLQRFEGHTGDVTAVALSEDGTHLASGSADGTVRRWVLDV